MIDSKSFTGPDPPEWRNGASVVYYREKLYYLGGGTDRVDVKDRMKSMK